MENDPTGREQLLQLGIRNVGVVVKGKQFIVVKRLEDLAKFLGVPFSVHTPLPPEELFKKWIKILRAAQRYVRQIPNEQISLNAQHARKRQNRQLSHHVFRIGEVYLECVVDGAKELSLLTRKPIEDGTLTTGEEIIRYGDDVIARLEQWWTGLADNSCREKIDIADYGVIPIHLLLERSTWHSAHHTRQIIDVLERQGIKPDGRLTNEDMAGLPLPKQLLWE